MEKINLHQLHDKLVSIGSQLDDLSHSIQPDFDSYEVHEALSCIDHALVTALIIVNSEISFHENNC